MSTSLSYRNGGGALPEGGGGTVPEGGGGTVPEGGRGAVPEGGGGLGPINMFPKASTRALVSPTRGVSRYWSVLLPSRETLNWAKFVILIVASMFDKVPFFKPAEVKSTLPLIISVPLSFS